MNDLKRGEIWLIDLNPTRGQEIQKVRPGVVVSRNIFGAIPIRIVVPITSWQPKFENRPFMVRIPATSESGLSRDSAGNTLQIRSMSIERFIHKLGEIPAEVMKELLAALVICIDE
jgi:mRNA interferase MazF